MKRIILSTQRGTTLLETLLGMAIGLVVMGLCVGFALSLSNFFRVNTERNRLLSYAQLTKDLLADDLKAAGKAIKGPPGNRLLVRDRLTNGPRPAVWLADDGRTMTVVATSPATSGQVIFGGGPSGTAVVVSGIDFGKWNLEAGSLVVFANPTQPPALYQLRTAPRRATAGDLGLTAGRYNFARTAYLSLGPVPACFPVDTLTTQIEPGAAAVPVVRVARYTVGDYGLSRTEYTACTGSTATARVGNEVTPLFPDIETTHRFRYLTSGGRADAYADPRELRGIALTLTANDTRHKIKEEYDYEEFIPIWR